MNDWLTFEKHTHLSGTTGSAPYGDFCEGHYHKYNKLCVTICIEIITVQGLELRTTNLSSKLLCKDIATFGKLNSFWSFLKMESSLRFSVEIRAMCI